MSTSKQDRRTLERRKDSLQNCMYAALDRYFQDMEGHEVVDVYDMVRGEVEQAMLEVVMNYTQGNQTRAADVLGMSRATLRKKLRVYDVAQ
ncbi:MAG: DNA-binding transcriptional regulator Fis [Gammaproteobacteria bacterium]|nr:DNA-binding transcriptional regulator Fis [Gammaproteobacteria bacterium]